MKMAPERLKRFTARLSVGVAVALMGLKLWAVLSTHSVAILSSLMDSLLDALVSVINLLALQWAMEPADEEHRFGHTSVEDIAGLVQSAFIAGSALFVIGQSLARFWDPEPVLEAQTGIQVMLVCMGLTLLLVLWQQYVIRRVPSMILEADSLHYISDLAANLMTLLAVWLAGSKGLSHVDSLIGLILALWILKGAHQIGIRAFHNLMDRELSEESRKKIIGLIHQDQRIVGFHHLKTRASGSKIFIQLHLDLPGELSLKEAHAIADALEERLMALFEEAEVMIHQDPV